MQNLKILVVDDDVLICSLMHKRLSIADYEVEIAVNGMDALEKLDDQYYDVVLTDVMMPGGVDGIGVLEAAKAHNIKTEVILITGYGTIDNAIEAMKKGATDYLQKPINFDELFLRLDKISNFKRLMKNASDLREAMTVTEQISAETIQNLEMTVADLESRLAAIQSILASNDVLPEERICLALSA